MARTVTPSGIPRPMPILAQALGPPGRGVGKVERVVDNTEVGEAGKGGPRRDEEVDVGVEANSDEEVGLMMTVDVRITVIASAVSTPPVTVDRTEEVKIFSWPLLMIVLKVDSLLANSGAVDMTEGEDESISSCIVLITSTTRTVINQ